MRCYKKYKNYTKKNKNIGLILKQINKDKFVKKFKKFRSNFKTKKIKSKNFYHIGSTTINKILAKPILDVMYVTDEPTKTILTEFKKNKNSKKIKKCIEFNKTWALINLNDINLHIVRRNSKKFKSLMKYKKLLKTKKIRDEYIKLKKDNINAKNSTYKNDFFKKYKLN